MTIVEEVFSLIQLILFILRLGLVIFAVLIFIGIISYSLD